MLDDMGISQSEFGFPTTKHELNYLNGNLELVDRGVITKTKLSGWMRAVAKDVVESFRNVPRLKYVNLSQSTSDQMINGKYGGKKQDRISCHKPLKLLMQQRLAALKSSALTQKTPQEAI